MLNSRKKYGLVWEEKEEAVEELLREKLPVLTEVVEKRIIAKDSENAPNHILIEGDNLHALTALLYTHAEKVDVICIDPPYNRGKKDFKYNDSYIDIEHSWRHSLWSCFIYKRLILAKYLLSPHGVVIVHIDENEFAALHHIMNEVFREQNSLGTIVWNKKNPKGDPKEVSTMHEYIYVYAKNKEEFKQIEKTLLRKKLNAQEMLAKANRIFSKIGRSQIPDEIKQIVKPFGFSDEVLKEFEVTYTHEMVNKEYQSWLSRQNFSGGELAYKMIDEKGRVYRPVSMAWPNKENAPEEYWKPLIHPVTGVECPVPNRGWRNPPKTMKQLAEKGLILFGLDHTTQPCRKYLLEENLFENVPSIYEFAGSDDDLLADLKVKFEYPKPVVVEKYLLNGILPQAKIILDFFAGSGTTLHATMELNAEDGGSRRCILVTNNENNICDEATYKRNKNVIQGYTKLNGESVPGLINNNLRYYKTSFIDREPSIKNRKALTRAAVDLLCIRENCYKQYKKLDGKDIRVFSSKECELIIIFDPQAIDEAIDIIQKLYPGKTKRGAKPRCKVYIFAPGHYAYDDEFECVIDKIELCALPEAIYRAYKAVLPKAKTKSLDEIAGEGVAP